MSDIKKKVDFIIAWYNNEKSKFSFANQIILAKTWIDICTKNDEYEMASAITKEKDKVIREYLKKKRESRTWKQRLRYYFLKLKRSIIK